MSKRRNVTFGIVIAICVLAGILSLCLGAANLSVEELWQAICDGSSDSVAGNIFWYVRLPRTIGALLSGAALAVSGAIIQNVLANKLASPGIIGVNAGAGLAVTICIACGVVSGWLIAGVSFLGALIAVLLIVLTAEKAGASKTTVILGGVAVNTFLNAIAEAITTLMPEVALVSGDFRVGGFAAVVPARLLPAGILIVIGLLMVFTLCNELDIMMLGEETAKGLGLPVRKMRIVFLFLAALLAGASVSFAGLLGFVGLIVPHMARKLVGGESKYVLPFSALSGAAFVALCDLAARMVFQPYEVPVGIFMSFIGGPFFIFLLWKHKGGHAGD